MRRTELRRQKWRIKQRELELVASKNFLRPRLDTIGRYRWRGIGHDLITHSNETDLDSAFDNLLSGNFQEWQLGFELSFPVGWRQASAAVRNAHLQLAREHALLHEQEREVTHDLSNAIGELERAYVSAKLNYNRRLAARQQLAALEARARGDLRTQTRYLDLILDAQRRLADAESRYYRSLTEYVMAIRLVHYNKGSLLDYNEIRVAEGPWPEKAYHDAARRERLRLRAWRLENFVLESPPPVSRGSIPQDIDSGYSDDLPVQGLPIEGLPVQDLPMEVLPAPESSSPLPPPPPQVMQNGGGRPLDTATTTGRRRSLAEARPSTAVAMATASSRRPQPGGRRPPATNEPNQLPAGVNSELARIGQRLTLEENLPPLGTDANSSVLFGTLLEQPSAVEDQAFLPVVRFATIQPGQMQQGVRPVAHSARAAPLDWSPQQMARPPRPAAPSGYRSTASEAYGPAPVINYVPFATEP